MLRRRFCSTPLIAAAGSWPALAIGAAASPPGGETARGVSRRPLVFPADFGAHPDTRIEWWYITGALTVDGSGQPTPAFGFQLTFFRVRTGIAPDHPSRFAAQQLVLAHGALSSVAERRLRHDQAAARSGFEVADAKTGDTEVWLRNWRLRREGIPAASRYAARIDSVDAGFGFELSFESTQALLLQGDAGYSRKGPQPAQASHYYSQPQLRAAGRLSIDGKRLAVQGKAWLDHEWSNSLLAADAVGWDWIGINLDDGSVLTAFRLRRADGSALYAGGSWRQPGNPGRNFAADEVVFSARRRWRSPHTQADYPVEWLIETPAGRFHLEALFDDQELDSRRSTGAVYWEGLSRLRDAGRGRLLGHGYLEMTGYAAPLQI
ncbi:lipocalin-like domain-containing protein [Piscinibacter sakaiensis]|uniref:lipocalin-like domain-containing protein n=1 Tax=Piscinibacter sakaiensis TaxID=1547922 RepID=UPI003AB0E2A1